jgi:hypothetical protein
VALCAVEAFPHSTIVANKNLFSHANLLSTPWLGFCQVMFQCRSIPGGIRQGSPITSDNVSPDRQVNLDAAGHNQLNIYTAHIKGVYYFESNWTHHV